MSRFGQGQRVFIPGTALMGGIGVGDDEQMVQIDDGAGFAIVAESALIDATPMPGSQVIVERADLRAALDMMPPWIRAKLRHGVLDRLRDAAVTEWPAVRLGDVWKDKDGNLWFVAEKSPSVWQMVCDRHDAPAPVSAAAGMTLEWRPRPDSGQEPRHSCEHQASNFTPCTVCGA